MKRKSATVQTPEQKVEVVKADLNAEFAELVGKALTDLHVVRLEAVARAFPERAVIFAPVLKQEITRAQSLAQDIAMTERSACLNIVRRILMDAALSNRVDEAICAERGAIQIPMHFSFTWDDNKGWAEYKIAT